jgi:hypothetical protein
MLVYIRGEDIALALALAFGIMWSSDGALAMERDIAFRYEANVNDCNYLRKTLSELPM